VPDLHNNSEARESILRSIRSHLAASVPHDERETASHHVSVRTDSPGQVPAVPVSNGSLARMFKENLEAVDGHCVVAQNEVEIARELTAIISGIQQTGLRGRRIAISDVPMIERLMHLTDLEVDELTVTPNAIDLFGFDVGITTAQAAIAETGTLVLDAARERHRLISLVPPVHIAIVDAVNIYQTLGETLSVLHKSRDDVSAAITFITGPSRTADIELTLAIGVHGPQELYMIINEGPALE
jgi:L-lactate dehydrogenase complex protein LldG